MAIIRTTLISGVGIILLSPGLDNARHGRRLSLLVPLVADTSMPVFYRIYIIHDGHYLFLRADTFRHNLLSIASAFQTRITAVFRVVSPIRGFSCLRNILR